MLSKIPTLLNVSFIGCAIITFLFFSYLVQQSNLSKKRKFMVIGLILSWITVQSGLALNQFYSTFTMSTPPRYGFVLLPTTLLFFWLFLSQKGKNFIDRLPLVAITYFNMIRIPVELCLYGLFLNESIPELMTFAGRNHDIIAGITAPFIAYFGLQKQAISTKWILVWNFLMLGLLINIIINALLSAPTILQQFAFEQPNIAIGYFPFILLPAFIVPMVLLGHFTAIRKLINIKNI